MSGTVLSTVYTYGAGKVLFYVFNAIAMLFNGGFMASLFNLMLMLSLCWAGLKAGINRDSHKEYAKWFLSYLFVLLVLIQPPNLFKNGGMTIHIRDIITNKAYKVDNLPPGLVLPASFISGLGFAMTKSFETVFSDVDSNYLPYHKYGTMFGAHVMSEFKSFTIQDPVFAENMESYISNCIAYDVMIGRKYDISELNRATNAWELIKENASALRMFNYRNGNKGGRALLTCKDGIPKLEASFFKESELLAKIFPTFNKLSSTASTVNNGIINAIKLSTDFYGNHVNSASDTLRQLLITNAFKNVPASYGKIKAVQTQNSSWSLTGELAQTTLPIIHAIFQALIYSVFPIIVSLLFFSQRFQTLKMYFEMMFWIELWPILFAILNLAVSVFAQESGAVSDITIGNINNIVSSQSSYAMCAASLGLMVPTISYMLAKGGVSSFVHMAGSLLSGSSSGVGAAVNEVTSGNMSLDNVNIGNRSYNNLSANKLNTAGEIATGFMKQTLSDGTIQTDFLGKTDGSRIYQGGAGLSHSVGNTSVNSGQSILESVNKQLQNGRSVGANYAAEIANTDQLTERQAVDVIATMSEREASGHSYDFKNTTAETEQLNQIFKTTKELHDHYGYDWNQAATHAFRAGTTLDGGVTGAMLGKIMNKGIDRIAGEGAGDSGSGARLGLSGNFGYGYEGTSSNTERQGLEEKQSAIADRSNAALVETVLNATKEVNWSASDSTEHSMVDNLSSSYESLTQKRESLAHHESRMQQTQETYDNLQNIHLNSDRGVYDELMCHISEKLDPDPYAKTPRIGLNKARQIIEKGGPEFYQYVNQYAKSKLQYMKMPANNNYENSYYDMSSNGLDYQNTKNRLDAYAVPNNIGAKQEESRKQYSKDLQSDRLALEKNFNDRAASATKSIENQKMKTNDVGDSIKTKVNAAEKERSEAFIKRWKVGVGKKNPNKGGWDENS